MIAAKLPRLNTIDENFAIARTKKYIPTFFGSNSLTNISVIAALDKIPADFIETSLEVDLISKFLKELKKLMIILN